MSVAEALRMGGSQALVPERLKVLAGVPHPFPYQGSKRALAHAILPFLPPGTAALVEPFAGSAAVSIAARHAGMAAGSVINDVNAPLMALWQAIVDDSAGLADRYERLWTEARTDPKGFFLATRAEFN